MTNSCKGAAPIILLYILGAAALTQLVPNWRVTHLFEKGPQTKQLKEAQDAAAKAKADAEAAESRYQTALADQKAKTVAATQYSQQMIAGVPVALGRAQQSPEVIFAASLAKRAASGLSVAIGDLPADKQAEIAFIVEQALSAKQAEVDAARAALAIKDKELSDTKEAKQVIEAKLPVLEQQAKSAEAKAVAADAQVMVKTSAVAAYAEKAAAKEEEAGSLGTLVTKLLWVIGICAALYVFAHFMLPSLAQEFPAASRLVAFNKTVKSLVSSHL